VTDKSGKIVNRMVPQEFKSWLGTGPGYKIYRTGDKVMGFNQFSPILYELDADGAKARYEFSVEGFTFPDAAFFNEISDFGKNDYYKALKHSDRISYYEFYETSDMLTLMFMHQGKSYIGTLNKQNGTTHLFSIKKIEEDLQLGSITYFCATSLNNSIIAIILPMDIIEAHKEGVQIDPRLLSAANHTGADGNQIIAIFKLK